MCVYSTVGSAPCRLGLVLGLGAYSPGFVSTNLTISPSAEQIEYVSFRSFEVLEILSQVI